MMKTNVAGGLVEVVALLCVTVLCALGRLPAEAAAALLTLTLTGHAMARAGGKPPSSGGSIPPAPLVAPSKALAAIGSTGPGILIIGLLAGLLTLFASRHS